MEDTQLATAVERLAKSLGELSEPVAKPALVVVSGLPGTGKSYFSSKLAERSPFVILESDTLRKTLFPEPAYSAEESAFLFKAIHLLIEHLLKKGISLIFDATNLSERHREYLYSITERVGVKLVLVRVEAPPELVAERLKSRKEQQNSHSDADWRVYERMRPSVEKIGRKHFVVDTSREVNTVIDKILKELRH